MLRLTIIRKGKEQEVTVRLKRMGRFSDTYPVNCTKSKKLVADALRYLLTTKEKLGQCHEKATVGLAMLAQGKLPQARMLAYSWNKAPGPGTWTWPVSYQCIFLCEYYLKTRDKNVLRTIDALTKILYTAQVMDPAKYKDWKHGGKPQAKNFLLGGFGHVVKIDGYGTMTLPTCLAILAWELAEDCGIKVDRKRVDLAYACVREHTHKTGYMGYRFANGAYSPVGRQGLAILVHKMIKPTDEIDAYIKRVTGGLVNARNRINDGHGDNVLSLFWALVGIQASGDKQAIRKVLDYNKVFINMARTHDGSFVAQPGRNTGDKGYYLSSRIHPTAAMILILSMDQPKLRLEQGCSAKGK